MLLGSISQLRKTKSHQLYGNSITEPPPTSPSASVRMLGFSTTDSASASRRSASAPAAGQLPSSLPPGWPRAQKRPAGLKT
ncbi:hypothetical protein PBY51_016629 [Eleginops maclovinus]|uniref:Uncharacterized protein n=1 Tax=Eleginops maclovinus TaxID=56733 RepID=A0AAN7WQA3_ELEMC|nr:hypothetical protein PBY51_016629 [Eleginops maclovinus]